jgi:hypothetical protein
MQLLKDVQLRGLGGTWARPRKGNEPARRPPLAAGLRLKLKEQMIRQPRYPSLDPRTEEYMKERACTHRANHSTNRKVSSKNRPPRRGLFRQTGNLSLRTGDAALLHKPAKKKSQSFCPNFLPGRFFHPRYGQLQILPIFRSSSWLPLPHGRKCYRPLGVRRPPRCTTWPVP